MISTIGSMQASTMSQGGSSFEDTDDDEMEDFLKSDEEDSDADGGGGSGMRTASGKNMEILPDGGVVVKTRDGETLEGV